MGATRRVPRRVPAEVAVLEDIDAEPRRELHTHGLQATRDRQPLRVAKQRVSLPSEASHRSGEHRQLERRGHLIFAAGVTPGPHRIAKLEAHIDKLETEQRKLRERLTQAQIEQWQGRIEDIEVQSHLASLEAQDRLGPLRDDLRNQWLDVKTQLGHSKDTASDVIDTLRESVEAAIKALRDAVQQLRWSSDRRVVKLVFLVGDAPPHEDYPDGDWRAVLGAARRKGLDVVALQCGTDPATERVWREVATLGHGDYVQLDAQGGMTAQVTPQDVTPAGPNWLISTAVTHNCALRPYGGVECWGSEGTARSGDVYGSYTQVYHTPVSYTHLTLPTNREV